MDNPGYNFEAWDSAPTCSRVILGGVLLGVAGKAGFTEELGLNAIFSPDFQSASKPAIIRTIIFW